MPLKISAYFACFFSLRSLKDNSNNPALLEPALDAIIQLETEDEKVVWDHLAVNILMPFINGLVLLLVP